MQIALALSESAALATAQTPEVKHGSMVEMQTKPETSANAGKSSLNTDPYGFVGATFKKTYTGYGKELFEVRVIKYTGNDTYQIEAIADGHRSRMKACAIAKYELTTKVKDDQLMRPLLTENAKQDKIEEDESVEVRRRSSRDRKSRFIEIDGHTILRENNYGLSEGIRTISGSDLRAQQRKLEKVKCARSAFVFFGQAYRKIHGWSNQGTIGSAWRQLDPSERAQYDKMAADDKIRYERERSINEAKARELEDEAKRRSALIELAERRAREVKYRTEDVRSKKKTKSGNNQASCDELRAHQGG